MLWWLQWIPLIPEVTEHIESGHISQHITQRSQFLGDDPGAQEESYIDLYTLVAPHLLLYQVFVELAHVRNRENIPDDLPPLEYPIECQEEIFDDRIEHTYIVSFTHNVGFLRNERIPHWRQYQLQGQTQEIVFQRQLKIVIVIDLAAPDYRLPVSRRLKTVHPYGNIVTRYGHPLYDYDYAVRNRIIDTSPLHYRTHTSRTGY